MSITLKAKAVKELFARDDFYIISMSPITPYPKELKINQYFSFTVKGSGIGYLQVGQTYELVIEEQETNQYGTSYSIVDCPTISKMDFNNLSRKEAFAILRGCTSSDRIANNILDVYPTFITKILTEGKESIDLKLIKGVGEAYLSCYARELTSKYKYFSLLTKYSDFNLTVQDCKALFDAYIDEQGIDHNIQEKPYEVFCVTLDRSFSNADKILKQNRPDLKDSEQRCVACILDILTRNENDGSTILNGNVMYLVMRDEYNVPELLDMVVDVCKNSEHIWYDENSKNIAKMQTYLAECRVAQFVKDKLSNSHKWDIDVEKYRTVNGRTLNDAQMGTLKNVCDYNISLLAGYAGCVDCDTEFFNGIEWKKISEFSENKNDKILMWDAQKGFVLGDCQGYHKLSCDTLYRMTDKDGLIDEVLSLEHRVVYLKDGSYHETEFWNILNDYKNHIPFKYNLPIFGEVVVEEVTINNDNITIEPYATVDGYKYCFSVDTTMLVLRRNGKRFITGNCGKTFSVKNLIDMLEDNGYTYSLLSFSGKASRVLAEATGRNASTIHKKCLTSDGIDSDVILVDEFTMTGLDTMCMLLNSVTNEDCKFIFCGDVAQIPAISLGRLFKDIIDSGKVPTTMLTEVFRYNSDGALYAATQTRQGEMFLNDNKVTKKDNSYSLGNNFEFIEIDDDDEIKKEALRQYRKLIDKGIKKQDIVIITPMNKGNIGTIALNNEIQAEFNPPKPNELYLKRKYQTKNIIFRVGDIVLNCKNDYKSVSYDAYVEMMESGGILKEDDVADKFIMNGQLGIVREVIENEGLVVQYDEDLIYVNKGKLNHLLLGYCLSCHKSQGSTMPYVINIISDSHQRMLNRNLEYVAITRACNKTICIGSYGAFSDCLAIEANDERNTLLRELILE